MHKYTKNTPKSVYEAAFQQISPILDEGAFFLYNDAEHAPTLHYYNIWKDVLNFEDQRQEYLL